MNILNVNEELYIDNSITHSEIHSYEPYLPNKLSNNDKIIIPVHEIEKYTHPCESFLYIEGVLSEADGNVSKTLSLINNGVAFLFRELRYQLNSATINSRRDVGLTLTLKGYISYTSNESEKLKNANWSPKGVNAITDATTGAFNVCIPLKMLMGFFEDYKKIIINAANRQCWKFFLSFQNGR